MTCGHFVLRNIILGNEFVDGVEFSQNKKIFNFFNVDKYI